jgi:hypothetical protein
MFIQIIVFWVVTFVVPYVDISSLEEHSASIFRNGVIGVRVLLGHVNRGSWSLICRRGDETQPQGRGVSDPWYLSYFTVWR